MELPADDEFPSLTPGECALSTRADALAQAVLPLGSLHVHTARPAIQVLYQHFPLG